MRELLIARVTTRRRGLGFFEEIFEPCRIGALDHAETRLIAHVVGDFGFGRPIIEVKRRFTFVETSWIESIKRPNAGLDRELLLGGAICHVIAVRNAVAVRDDQRRPLVRFSF